MTLMHLAHCCSTAHAAGKRATQFAATFVVISTAAFKAPRFLKTCDLEDITLQLDLAIF